MTLETVVNESEFLVIHPLDDAPEEKLDTAKLGPMQMTPTVRVSLWVLRGYLIVMTLLVLYHVLDLAGLTRHA